jgi:hypothetical protein
VGVGFFFFFFLLFIFSSSFPLLDPEFLTWHKLTTQPPPAHTLISANCAGTRRVSGSRVDRHLSRGQAAHPVRRLICCVVFFFFCFLFLYGDRAVPVPFCTFEAGNLTPPLHPPLPHPPGHSCRCRRARGRRPPRPLTLTGC